LTKEIPELSIDLLSNYPANLINRNGPLGRLYPNGRLMETNGLIRGNKGRPPPADWDEEGFDRLPWQGTGSECLHRMSIYRMIIPV
jgi:hypothetical protein